MDQTSPTQIHPSSGPRCQISKPAVFSQKDPWNALFLTPMADPVSITSSKVTQMETEVISLGLNH